MEDAANVGVSATYPVQCSKTGKHGHAKSSFYTEDLGRYLLAVEDLLHKHGLFEAHIASQGDTIRKLNKQAQSYIDDGHKEAPILQKRLNKLNAEYDNLVSLAANRRTKLEVSRTYYQFVQDQEEEDAWVVEKQYICKAVVPGKDLQGALSLQQKHKALEVEINARWPQIKKVMESGNLLISEKHPESPDISIRVDGLKKNWDKLHELWTMKCKLLEDASAAYQYQADANEAESWMKEKRQLMSSTDYGKDEPSAQALLQCHARLESEIKVYSSDIERLNEQAEIMIKSGMATYFLSESLDEPDTQEWVEEVVVAPVEEWMEEVYEKEVVKETVEDRKIPQVGAMYKFSGQDIEIDKGELIDICDDGFVTLMSDKAETRDDLRIPEGELGQKIKEEFGKEDIILLHIDISDDGFVTLKTDKAETCDLKEDITTINCTEHLFAFSFEHLQNTCMSLQQGSIIPSNLDVLFYTVEGLFEKLQNYQTYLDSLMNFLLAFLSHTENYILKELAVGAMFTVAIVSKELFQPYIPHVLSQLLCFIFDKTSNCTQALKRYSIDILCAIVGGVCPEEKTMACDCLQYVLQLIEENDDPWIQASCYRLITTVTRVLKSDIVPYLNCIVQSMLVTLKSVKGIDFSVDRYGTDLMLFNDDEDYEIESVDKKDDKKNIQLEEDDDCDDLTRYSLTSIDRNPKEFVCLALKTICSEVGLPVIPFIEECFNKIRRLLDSPCAKERVASISLLRLICSTVSHHLESGNDEFQIALEEYINILLPKLFSLAREDTEHVVIICLCLLEEIIEVLNKIGFNGDVVESICYLIKDVYNNKLACQKDNYENSEHFGCVLAGTCQLMKSLVKVVPGEQFSRYLGDAFTLLFARTKESCSTDEKAVIISSLSDIVLMQPHALKSLSQHLKVTFLSGMEDENNHVRDLSAYGLRVLEDSASS